MDDSKTLNLNVEKIFQFFQKRYWKKRSYLFWYCGFCSKTNTVINETNDFYKNHYSNVSRGVHTLSVESTFRYEDARKKVQNS